MLEHSPTIEGFIKEFSQDDVEFANVDDDDAFELVRAEPETAKYLNFVFRVRKKLVKVRAKCMVQGCNTSVVFYPWFKAQIFYRILGRLWKVFYAAYQDDTIVKAPKGRCRVRLTVLETIYDAFGVIISPRCFDENGKIPIGPEVVAAGFLIGRNNQIYCNEMLDWRCLCRCCLRSQ
jgi:hypothetical protein